MNPKVLIIEDSNIMSRLWEMTFENEGFKVLVANSGKDGIQVAKKEHPGLILLDLMMPELDGFGVFESILADEDTAKIPVVFFSNFSKAEDREKAKRMGAVDFIIKSNILPDQLVERIKEILAGKSFLK
ncbi:MAG: response regulator [Armatimonadetes bacterium]|nr:response regulator [Armatimonadota bacterium]